MNRRLHALIVLCVAASVGGAMTASHGSTNAQTPPQLMQRDSTLHAVLQKAVQHQWTLRLTTTTGDSITARAVSLTDTTLGIVSNRIPLSTLQRIEHRTSTSNVMTGLVAGAIPGAILGYSLPEIGDDYRAITTGSRIEGVIGGAVMLGGFGAFIEAMVGKSRYKWDPVWPTSGR